MRIRFKPLKAAPFFPIVAALFSVVALFSAVTLFAANPPGGFATVDTRLILLLHPSMANFDFSNGKFFRSETPNKKFEDVLKELQACQKKSGEALKGLEEQRRRLSASKTDLLTRREDVINDLYVKVASTGYQVRGKEEKIQEFEGRYLLQLAQLDAQISQNADQIRKALEIGYSTLYLTTEETEKRLSEIKTEIQSLISEAARESGISVVIDNTYAMRSQNKSGEVSQVPVIDEALDVVSSSLFHSFANLQIDPALKGVLKNGDGMPIPEEHLLVGRSIGLMNNLQRYLQFRNYFPEKIGNFSPGQMFLVGGVDLTPWVARKLFARYRIPGFLQNSFMVLIRNYSDFERNGNENYLKGRN